MVKVNEELELFGFDRKNTKIVFDARNPPQKIEEDIGEICPLVCSS
jgi:hypothetical protein